MKHNKVKIIGLLLIVALLFVGCKSSDKSAMDHPAGSATPDQQAQNEAGDKGGIVAEDGSTNTDNSIPDTSRKLIRTVDLTIETKEFDKLTTGTSKKITELGGYIESSNIDGTGYDEQSDRSGNIVARIPKAKLDEFIKTIGGFGNIVNQQEKVSDVTLSYVDIESHKKSLTIEQERLLSLLEKADRLEDIITLENRLSEVRYQLESFESQLRTYDNLVDYSTVSIRMNEVDRIVKKGDGSMWSKMTTGFQRSARDIGNGLQNLAIWFVSNLIYLVILGVILVGVLLFVGRQNKKNKAIVQMNTVQGKDKI